MRCASHPVHINRFLRQAAALFAACLTAFLLPLSAAAQTASLPDAKISLELSDAYTVLTKDNLKKQVEFLDRLGHTPTSFSQHMKDRHILLVAATEDNTRQVQVKSYETDFSKKIGELSRLDSDSLAQATETLLAQNAGDELLTYGPVTKGDLVFLKSVNRVGKISDKQTDFCYIQFSTIRNGKYYALVYYNASGELTESQADEAASILSSLTLPKKKGESLLVGSNEIIQIVIVGVLLVAAFVILIVLIVSFIKDVRARKREDEQTVHIRIKRRKF